MSCSLQCSYCFRQNEKFPSIRHKYQDISWSDFEKIARHFREIEFCGTIGDPIFHSDFQKMLYLCKGREIKTRVATAASHKPIDWYQKCFEINPNVVWVFGIDGLPKSSANYRKNQDGHKLFEVMLLAKKMNVSVYWQYLIFKYNENEIFEAIKLAQQNDIPIQVFNTKRQGGILTPSQKYSGLWRADGVSKTIVPKCLTGKNLGHSAMGYLTPCCWFGDLDVETEYPELCNEKTKISNVDSVAEIF